MGLVIASSRAMCLSSSAAFPLHPFSRVQNRGANRSYLLCYTGGVVGVKYPPRQSARPQGQTSLESSNMSLCEPRCPQLSRGSKYKYTANRA